MPKTIRVGTSGYNNFRWQGIFYPADLPRSKWFEFYCEHFETFEINAAFYKFPTVKGLRSWYRKSPPGFTFAVKAPKIITHTRRFAGCTELLSQFYEICTEGLAEKLGPILFQFPPSFKFSAENLELIINSTNAEYQNVFEFRNETWWNAGVFDAFSRAGLTFASVSYPNIPDDMIQNSSLDYIRLHGVPKLFYSEYGAEFLRDLYRKVVSGTSPQTFVFFNNTASAAGISDALELRNLLKKNVNNV